MEQRYVGSSLSLHDTSCISSLHLMIRIFPCRFIVSKSTVLHAVQSLIVLTRILCQNAIYSYSLYSPIVYRVKDFNWITWLRYPK